MSKHMSFKSGWLRASGLALGLLVFQVLGSGCGSDESSLSLTGPESELTTPASTVEASVEMEEVYTLDADMQRDSAVENVADEMAVRGGIFQDLDLTQEQIEALRVARQEFREGVAALLEQYGDSQGSIEFQEALDALRAELEASIQEILTAEQYDMLNQYRQERFVAHVQHLIDRIAAHRDRVIAFLTRAVDLTEEQAAAITQIFDSRIAFAEDVLSDLDSGQLTLDGAKSALRGFLQGIPEEIAEVLTQEQLDILEASHPHGPRPDGGRH